MAALETRSADQPHHVVHVGGGVRRVVGALHPEGGHGVPPQSLVASGHLARGRSSCAARAMILSSMSVTLETKRTSSPLQVK